MLSREQWTKPSFDDFIAWLETKDPNEEYCWTDASVCACGQYAASIGVEKWSKQASRGNQLWTTLNNLAAPRMNWYFPRSASDVTDTFGALLERARTYKELETLRNM